MTETHASPFAALPATAGIGLKAQHYRAALEHPDPGLWVEVHPEDYMGDVIGDLSSRRGQVSGTEARGIDQVVSAMVPLANMFKYVDSLRSMSQGRAQYSMVFDHYEQVPQMVADEVIEKYA